MRITLAYPPSTNRLCRSGNGRHYTPVDVLEWKRIAGYTARARGATAIDGPVALGLVLHPKSRKDGQASSIRIDLDNALKATMDALNGIAWQDDRQIVRIIAEVGEPVPGGGLSVSWIEDSEALAERWRSIMDQLDE